MVIFSISGTVHCSGINKFNARNYAGNSSHISHMESIIQYFHQVPFVLKFIENQCKWSFFAFWALKLLRHTLNNCWKICWKLISHLAFGMQYLAFPSGAIYT